MSEETGVKLLIKERSLPPLQRRTRAKYQKIGLSGTFGQKSHEVTARKVPKPQAEKKQHTKDGTPTEDFKDK